MTLSRWCPVERSKLPPQVISRSTGRRVRFQMRWIGRAVLGRRSTRSTRNGRAPTTLQPDHDPVARLQLTEPVEHRRAAAGVDMTDDHRRLGLPRPRPRLLPAGKVNGGHLHRPVRPQSNRHHPGVDPDRRNGDGHRPPSRDPPNRPRVGTTFS
jgi:hypothetical protein